jgi:CDP-glycerol glycerophosphotransferase (TagB/SpsB family)
VVDDSKTVFMKGQEGFSEILEDDMEHLANSLYHAAVVITTTSTISIDAARFDKPIINMAFDGWEKRPFHKSVRRKFTRHHAHYQPIVKSGGVYIVNTFDEMPAAINRYLEHPEYEQEGRARIVREQCQFTDGKSGERIGKALLAQL